MAVSARRCYVFLTSFFQFLCFVTWFWVLFLFHNRYVNFTRVRNFRDSFTLNDFFPITSETFVKADLRDSLRSSCPLLFSSLALRQWVGLVWYCLRQLLWKLASHAKKSKPRILCKSFLSVLFSAVSRTDIQTLPWLQLSKHFSLWSPYVPLYYRRYCQVSKSLSEKLWKNAQKF